MKRTTRFRQLIEAPEILILPGIADALTARVAATAGAQAIACGGYAATASMLGRPDTSLLTMSELADHYARICDVVDIPLFADADTGFGNVTNVARTVRAFERAGVASFFIEDQVYPKRCGHMAGKHVVPVEEMVAKLKAALDARQDPDLMIMARTDANAVEGIDRAIERAQIYREVGADILFVEAPTDMEQMQRIPAEIDGPCMANNIEGGRTPILPATALADMGYAFTVYPVSVCYTIAKAVDDVVRTLLDRGTTEPVRNKMINFDEFNALVGLPEVRRLEQDYARSAAETISKI